MSRERWIHYQGRLMTPEEYDAAKYEEIKHSTSGRGPMIISDNIPDLMNHADGKRYSSKRGLEKAVRAAGCEIVGNDPSFKRPKKVEYQPTGLRSDIKRSFDQARSK